MRSINRSEIVDVARSWIGTPYHHQASNKGAGCDCLGLVRGVYKEITGLDAETPPPYSKDWAEAQKQETLINAAERHLNLIESDFRRFGDVVIFRFKRTFVAKHAGILTSVDRMVHAVEGAPVCEVNLNNWWLNRIAAVFEFPNIKG